MEEDQILTDGFKAFLRYWRLVAISTVVMGLIALGLAFNAEPQYEASARILVTLSFSEQDYLRSRQPLQDFSSGVSLTGWLAKTYGAFIDFNLVKQATEKTGLSLSTGEIRDLVKSIKVKQPIVGAQIVEITAQYKEAKKTAALANNVSLLLEKKVKQLGTLTFSGTKTQPIFGFKFISKAPVPHQKVKPRKAINLLIGLILGFVLSTALAIILYRRDKSIKDADNVHNVLGDVPILARFPATSARRDLSPDNAGSVVNDVLLTLRTQLEYRASSLGIKTILVTGTALEDGKSDLTIGLGAAFAGIGKKILLIDTDLREASLTHALNVESSDGLTAVLQETISLEGAIAKSGIENLDVLPAGTYRGEPVDLLAAEAMAELLETARNKYDYVLVDARSASVAIDAMVLAGKVDGVLLLITAFLSQRDTIKNLLDGFSRIPAGVLGVAFNEAKPGIRHFSANQYAARKALAKSQIGA